MTQDQRQTPARNSLGYGLASSVLAGTFTARLAQTDALHG